MLHIGSWKTKNCRQLTSVRGALHPGDGLVTRACQGPGRDDGSVGGLRPGISHVGCAESGRYASDKIHGGTRFQEQGSCAIRSLSRSGVCRAIRSRRSPIDREGLRFLRQPAKLREGASRHAKPSGMERVALCLRLSDFRGGGGSASVLMLQCRVGSALGPLSPERSIKPPQGGFFVPAWPRRPVRRGFSGRTARSPACVR